MDCLSKLKELEVGVALKHSLLSPSRMTFILLPTQVGQQMFRDGSTSSRRADHGLLVLGVRIAVHPHHRNVPPLHHIPTLVTV